MDSEEENKDAKTEPEIMFEKWIGFFMSIEYFGKKVTKFGEEWRSQFDDKRAECLNWSPETIDRLKKKLEELESELEDIQWSWEAFFVEDSDF
jgi:hypothetical protein